MAGHETTQDVLYLWVTRRAWRTVLQVTKYKVKVISTVYDSDSPGLVLRLIPFLEWPGKEVIPHPIVNPLNIP